MDMFNSCIRSMVNTMCTESIGLMDISKHVICGTARFTSQILDTIAHYITDSRHNSSLPSTANREPKGVECMPGNKSVPDDYTRVN